jgi:hypothetical protein
MSALCLVKKGQSRTATGPHNIVPNDPAVTLSARILLRIRNNFYPERLNLINVNETIKALDLFREDVGSRTASCYWFCLCRWNFLGFTYREVQRKLVS